ncbi:polyprenol monophosphomannose synthase [Candidatus Peregrinibacteria bacterium]|nr:polyprenol monophosphomannose synthase [Candidatus Peregrinibacteria bacterium]
MLSLILPTYNESKNLERLLPVLSDVLGSIPHELIVVDDDSPDRTWEVAERIAKKDLTVKVLRRIGRRGLSSAVTEGFAMAAGDVLAVMDCDGQHDPHLLPRLYHAIGAGGAHIAVASRYMRGGSMADWGGIRLLMSRMGTFLARHVPRVHVSDPMSGYFAIRRPLYRSIAEKLKPTGFKILLEILGALPRGTRTAEVPLTFGNRWAGESKFSFRVQMEFLAQLFRIALQRLSDFLWEAQWVVLFLFIIGAAALLLPSAWNLRFLVLSPEVRRDATRSLQMIAERQGWLLSDIDPVSVTNHSLQFIHHEHRRGSDPQTCYIVRFDPLTLIPCAS